MRGRFDDLWNRKVSAEEPERLVARLADAGFEGILIHRAGYADYGAQIEAALGRILELDPKASADGRLSFFSLAAYERGHASDSAEERDRRRDEALHPVLARWGAGFSHPETGPQGSFRWCAANGEIDLKNGGLADRWASFSMKAVAARPPALLRVEGDLLSERIELPSEGTLFTRRLRVPPGYHVIQFHCDGERADAPLDPRSLVWRADNPVLEGE
jgi:hypothetical protein